MTAPDRQVRLRQPDTRTCGAACVVVAADLAAGRIPPVPGRETTFAADVLATHRRLTRSRLRGRPQLPWPRALGTPPWAVARELTAVTGRPHRVRLVRWSGPAPQRAGALFVGNRWLPRHVVLVVGSTDDAGGRPRCYEPASGRVIEVDLDRLARHAVPVGRWRWAWFSVSPRP